MNINSRLFVVTLYLFTFGTTFATVSTVKSYSTGTLNKNCECISEYFSFADMETSSTKIKLLTGKVLSKYCEVKDNKAICTVESEDKQENGGFVCPLECVTLTPTHPLTAKEKSSILEKAILEEKPKFRAKIPKIALDAFEKMFPNWAPPLIRKGDFQEYELKYYFLESAALSAPISYLSGGKQINEWFTVIIFYPDMKSTEAQSLSWALISPSSSKILRIEKLSMCNQHLKWPYQIYTRIQFMPTSPVTTALYCTFAGASDAAGTYEAVLNNIVSDKSPPSLNPSNDQHPSNLELKSVQWLESIWEDLKERESVIALIDGPANIRTGPSVQTKVVGECKNNSLAVIRPLNDAPSWIVVYPPLKKSPSGWNYVYCDGIEGWTSLKNLRPYPSRP